MAADLAQTASTTLDGERLAADGWVALEDDGRPDLPPLPPDPLATCTFAEEPPGAAEWADEMEGSPVHLPSDILAGILPGPSLVGELSATDPREVDEYHLVEMIAGCGRVAAWMEWTMAALAARLSRRVAMNPRGSLPTGEYVLNVTAQELAPRLGVSKLAARRLVENGRKFGLELENTGIALREGRIDYAKACAIARLLRDQPGDVAWAVQQEVLPDAPHQTVTQLERAVSRAIIAIDPVRATARHKAAREQRKVHHPRPLPDGMASMTAILPATDAAGLDLALEAAARAAKAAGDTRTIDQLRADAVALLGHGALEHGFIGVPEGDVPDGLPASPVSADQDEDPQPDARQGRGSGPADAGDHEPPSAPPADAAPVMHTGNSFLRTPHMPLGTIGGRRAQVHVTIPLSVLIPPELLRHPESPESPDQGDSCAPDLPEDWYPGPTPAEVAELDGYGPITPDVARALAYSADTWRRLITDPLSGQLLDVGRTRYRPPAAMAEFVRLRDGSCVSPTCSTSARSCQLDHVCPWYFGGVTSADNLAPECGRDHHVKSTGAFQLEHLGAGTFVWTTPSGHRYRRDHTGRITLLGDAAFGDRPTF